MTQKSKGADKIDGEQPPSGIPTKDWANTPISVRKFITSPLETKQKRKARPVNRLSTPIILLLNLGIVVGLTLYLVNKVMLPCVSPREVSALSVAIILLLFAHLVWRNVYTLIPLTIGIVSLGPIKLSPKAFINILNEIHPWKLSSGQLGIFVVALFIVITFLNLSSISPFHAGDEPLVIQGFSIQRLDMPAPKQLAPGEMLTIAVGEKVFVEVMLLGKIDATCTWFTSTNDKNAKTGCSTILNVPFGTKRDTLTVLVQSACGRRQEFSGIHIVVQP